MNSFGYIILLDQPIFTKYCRFLMVVVSNKKYPMCYELMGQLQTLLTFCQQILIIPLIIKFPKVYFMVKIAKWLNPEFFAKLLKSIFSRFLTTLLKFYHDKRQVSPIMGQKWLFQKCLIFKIVQDNPVIQLRSETLENHFSGP